MCVKATFIGIEQDTGSATVHLIGPESHVPNGIIEGCVRVRISFRVDFRVRVGFRVRISFRVSFKVMVWLYPDLYKCLCQLCQ